MTTQPSKQGKAWRRVAGFACVVGVFAALLAQVRWDEAASLIWRVDLGWVAIAGALYGGIQLCRALRFRIFVPVSTVPTMFAVTALHVLFLRILPLRTGELAYAFIARRASLTGLGEGLTHLLIVRLMDILIVGVCFAIATTAQTSSHGQSLFWALGLVGACVLGLASFSVLLRWALGLSRWLCARTGSTRFALVERLLGLLREAVAESARISFARLLIAGAASLAMWAFSFAVMAAVLEAFGLHVSVTQLVLGGSAAVVASFLPVGVIGTFGVLETGWALGFVLAGLSQTAAATSALGYSLLTLLFAGVFALYGEVFLRMRRNAADRASPARS